MAATKTFKIGEYAVGGIIAVEIKGKIITIINKDWDMSTGTRRSSDQSNAKELQRGTAESDDPNVRCKLESFLLQLTTSYYTDVIMKWIESKVKLETSLFW